MKIDPRNLRPIELVRLLNSMGYGEVIGERKLRSHRSRAGYKVSSGKKVDFMHYMPWLIVTKHKPKKIKNYQDHKEVARKRMAEISKAGRDIAPHPPVADPERKKKASRDFRFFCESYFPITFDLEWSKDHLKVIEKIEKAVLHGGLFAMAMPRGSGKTTLAECACIWAILYGHREFVSLIGSDESHASDMLDSIKTEFESNDELLADFPEACYPIRMLEGIPHRAKGQLYQGERTYIGWTARTIVLPTVPGSKASGAIVKVAGITGRIRGMKFKRPDGRTARPSLVILDDPQTDESARSLSQCAHRESILAGAVLGLAGPGKKISGIMPCTVIRPGDMADSILDNEKHPEFQGERTQMVYQFPVNEKLWDEYAEIRAVSLRSGKGLSEATKFYEEHRKEMDEGAIVAWEERYNYDELSAIQHAMNLKFQNEEAFYAEYQNDPLPEDLGEQPMMTADEITSKLNGIERKLIPVSCNSLTMFIDVQQKALFYVIVGFSEDFTGYVVDYGTYPDQRRSYFTLRDLKSTLSHKARGAGLEGSIYAGLEKLTENCLGREYKRDDGAFIRVDRCLIDANWGQSTDVVYQFVRQSNFSNILYPSHGRFVGASSIPFSEYKRKPGDRLGLNWRIPNVKGKRAIRHVLYDTNYWKSFVHTRLSVQMGDKGCLSLFGQDNEVHRMFSEHLTAEYRIRTEGRGRTVDEWKQRVDRPDNHFFDCLVGCHVAASIQGVKLPGTEFQVRKKNKRVRLSDLQRRKR